MRSVIVPSAISAAKPSVSESVGWGWMVRPRSCASEPTSIACTASAISSPALGPTMPAPEQPPCLGLDEQLRQAVVAALGQRRGPRPPTGRTPSRRRGPAPALRLGQPGPGDLRVRIGDVRDRPRVPCDVVAGDDLGRHLGLVRGLVGEHRLADHVADREDVAARSCASGDRRDEAALVDRDARRLGADARRRSAAARPRRGYGRRSGPRAHFRPQTRRSARPRPPSRRRPACRGGSPRSAPRCACAAALRGPGRIRGSADPCSSTTVTWAPSAS